MGSELGGWIQGKSSGIRLTVSPVPCDVLQDMARHMSPACEFDDPAVFLEIMEPRIPDGLQDIGEGLRCCLGLSLHSADTKGALDYSTDTFSARLLSPPQRETSAFVPG